MFLMRPDDALDTENLNQARPMHSSNRCKFQYEI